MVSAIKTIKLPKNNFPTDWQTVIYRNYGFVKTSSIAKVLKCDEKTVEIEAKRLGLGDYTYNEEWEKQGYQTIIRVNWHLLNHNQIMELLNLTETEFDYILKEEDFFWVKLSFKTTNDDITYFPLTEKQIEETNEIVNYLGEVGKNEGVPFEFFENDATFKNYSADSTQTNIIHGYFTPCGDVFKVDNKKYLPDVLLEKYQRAGINGLWMHGVLSTLSYYPFKESLSIGYEERRKELNELVERCAKYNIKVYLYINEPRCLPSSDFNDKISHLKGHTIDDFTSLCISKKEVTDYLYNAVYDLVKAVPNLGGFITITMSENLTHCHSLKNCNCPNCKDKPMHEQPAIVNNIIMKAIKDSGTKVELLANIWAWSTFSGWTIDMIKKALDMLDKDISIICVSEFGMPIEKGGMKSLLVDYSISNVGPSEESKTALTYARELGHRTFAKIQVNNSWESSAVPFLPVYDLIYKHIKKLADIGVNDFMLSWTLGGWPSLSLSLVNACKKDFDLDAWYEENFNENAKKVHSAINSFCDGFSEYPFSISTLYYSPKSLGYANTWCIEKDERHSAMVSYAFDDYENWIYPYTYEVYVSQYAKLLSSWKKGIEILVFV